MTKATIANIRKGYPSPMQPAPAFLRMFVEEIAFRMQGALRRAPAGFGDFHAAPDVRTPHEIVCHMTNMVGFTRWIYVRAPYVVQPLPDFAAEVARFYDSLETFKKAIETAEPRDASPEKLLQGPLSDVMAHIGQLVLLRHLSGSPSPDDEVLREP